MEKPRHNHPLWIIKSMVKGFRQIIIPFAFIFVTNLRKLNILIILGIILALLVVYFVLALTSWKSYIYYFDGNVLWVEKGVLVKQKQGIAMEQVTTMNTKQGLIDQVLGLQTLKIDTSSVNKGNEVSLLITPSEVDRLRSYFQNPTQPDPETLTPEQAKTSSLFPKYTVHGKELMIYAIASNGFFAGLIFISSIIGLLDNAPEFEKLLEDSTMGFLNKFSINSINNIDWWQVLLVVLSAIFIYVFFSLVVSVILAYIKYYQFEVTRNDKDILIEYGLFEKKKYIIPIHKIRAMYLSYGTLGQFLKLSTIKIESIGYGDEKGEAAILFPVASESRRKEIVQALLPNFDFEPAWIQPPKRAFSNYLISSIMFFTLVATVLTFTWKYGAWSFLLVAFLGFCGILRYKKSAITKDALKLVIQGGSITKSVTILPLQGIQSVSQSQNFLQKRKRLQSLTFAYQSNLPMGQRSNIRFLDEEIAKNISMSVFDSMR